MKRFYNFSFAIISASMILLGCETSAGRAAVKDASSPKETANSQNETTSDVAVSVDTSPKKTFTIHVKLQTPDGKPATWYICHFSCEFGPRLSPSDIDAWNQKAAKWTPILSDEFKDANASQISHDIFVNDLVAPNGNFKIEIVVSRQNYMFAEIHFALDTETVNGTGINFANNWSSDAWSLAPQGVYESKDGKITKTVFTFIKNGTMWIKGIASLDIPFNSYNGWSYEDKKITSNGTVADNLSSITLNQKYKLVTEEFSGILLKK